MPTPASILLAASAAIPLVLGAAHLFYTYSGKSFFPRDDELLQRMKTVSPRITRQTTIWNAGVGFHASHSFGAMLFGLVYGFLALQAPQLLFGSPFLLTLGMSYIAAMAVLARLYWFSTPFRGITLSAILFMAGIAAGAA